MNMDAATVGDNTTIEIPPSTRPKPFRSLVALRTNQCLFAVLDHAHRRPSFLRHAGPGSAGPALSIRRRA